MKILVTGGAGFIGSNIVNRYIAESHEVVIVDNLSTGKESNINSKANFYKVGIEEDGLEAIFEKEKPEVVSHHAAQIDVRKSVSKPADDARINIVGSINLFQQCIKHKVEKVIFASSGGAGYGEQIKFPADETHPLHPLSPYGIAKVSVELYLYFYLKAYNLNYTVLRYANVYGPHQNPLGEAGVVAIFTNAMLSGKAVTINGNGEQTRDYVYVGDVVEANVLSLTKGDGEAFNIGSGIETSVNEIAGSLLKATSCKIEPKYGNAKLGEQKRSVIDPTKAKKQLSWNNKVPLDEGIKKTVEWFKKFEANHN